MFTRWMFGSSGTPLQNTDRASRTQDPDVEAESALQEPLDSELRSHDSCQGEARPDTPSVAGNETATFVASSFDAKNISGSQFSGHEGAGGDAEVLNADAKPAEPHTPPLVLEFDGEPEDVPLPPSPPPETIVSEDPRLRAWQDILDLYKEEMKLRVRSLERRSHSQNLRSEFMQAAQDTIRQIHDDLYSPQAVRDSEPLPDSLAHLRGLFDSLQFAEAEVYATEEDIIAKDQDLSQMTQPVFENEESSLAMLDVLQQNDIDIRGMDVASMPSVDTSDDNGIQPLDWEAEKVDNKINQINILEDLYNSIREQRVKAEHAYVAATVQGHDSAAEHEKAATELEKRELAIQTEMKIAEGELDQLRAVPDSPVEALRTISAD